MRSTTTSARWSPRTSTRRRSRAPAVRRGMHPLRSDGARKVLAGITSVDEVLRATEERGRRRRRSSRGDWPRAGLRVQGRHRRRDERRAASSTPRARARRARKLRRDGIFLTELAEGGEAPRRADRGAPLRASRCRRFLARLGARPRARHAPARDAGRRRHPAGVERSRALTEQVESARLKSVLGQVRDRVNEGAALADAMARARRVPGSLRRAWCAPARPAARSRRCSSGSPTTSRARCGCGTGQLDRASTPLMMFGFACVVVGIARDRRAAADHRSCSRA